MWEMDGKQHLVHGETTNMFYSIMPSPNRLGKDAEMIYGDCGGFLFFPLSNLKIRRKKRETIYGRSSDVNKLA